MTHQYFSVNRSRHPRMVGSLRTHKPASLLGAGKRPCSLRF
ncbi:hypothetical protein [Mastigocladopsis repens]|nr:hypothetical protein [Mastigocladopsis repens]